MISAPANRPAEQDSHEVNIRAEQVEQLYSTGAFGVAGAYVAALILVGAIGTIGDAPEPHSAIWIGTITIIAAYHLLLTLLHGRFSSRFGGTAVWAAAATTAALLEGVWWGCATVFLPPAGRFDQQILTMGLALVVATGAIPAFGSHLPAFLAIFLPITVIAFFGQIAFGGALHNAVALMLMVYLITAYALGRAANANLSETLRLRFAKDALAVDLNRQKDLAEQASLAKSRFLAAASHDLRQPIHALSMFVGALSHYDMNSEMRQLIQHIEGSIQAMDGLFASLLDISRLDAGVVRPEVQTFAVAPVLERICREYTQDAASKGLELRLVRTDAYVRSDPVLLERILRNLIANAVRHTDHGKVLVGCRRGAALRLQVLDTGQGIAPQERGRVFEEFYQIANPERDRAKGLGLGLAIVKRLAQLLDHPLALRSELGRGTLVSLAVPTAPGAPAAATPASQTMIGGLGGALLLVIDDEPMVLEAMRRLLVGWGAEVIAAQSGAEMLDLLADCQRSPDLILCDYRLRGNENGVDVIRACQAQYNEDIPAVLVTGDTASDRLQEAQRSGFLVLHKPVANAKLRAAIGNLAVRRRERSATSALEAHGPGIQEL